MMQCLADPNLLKPYIILGLKPFQFPMRSFAQKDRNDLLQQSYLGFDHFIDKPGTPVHPSQLAENVRGSSSSWERMIDSRNGHTSLHSPRQGHSRTMFASLFFRISPLIMHVHIAICHGMMLPVRHNTGINRLGSSA